MTVHLRFIQHISHDPLQFYQFIKPIKHKLQVYRRITWAMLKPCVWFQVRAFKLNGSVFFKWKSFTLPWKSQQCVTDVSVMGASILSLEEKAEMMPNTKHQQKHTIPTIKPDGGSTKPWGHSSAAGPGGKEIFYRDKGNMFYEDHICRQTDTFFPFSLFS